MVGSSNRKGFRVRHFAAGAPNYAGGSVTLTHTYLQSAASTSNASSYTFTSQNIGTAASDRTIIVVATCRGAAASGTTATIAGVSATVDIVASNGASLDNVAIFRSATPTGTTADIVVNWGAAQLRCSISVYRVVGGTVELDDTEQALSTSTTATDLALSPTTSGGVAVAGLTLGASSGSVTWTNATEDADAQTGAEASIYSAASTAISSASHTITVQTTSTATNAVAAAAYKGTT